MLVCSKFDRFVFAFSACVGLACAVVGCSGSPDDTAQTVDYYRAHPKDRQTLLARCANDPGRLGNKPACINATQAENLEGIGSMRSLPPMGLSKGAPSGGATAPAPPPAQ